MSLKQLFNIKFKHLESQNISSQIAHFSQRLASFKMDGVEASKQLAGHRAVDNHIQDGFKVGIGSGSTIVYAIQKLAERVKNENLQVTCIPTSFQSRQLIIENNLALSDLDITPELDIAIDGADEADKSLTLIKGGGGCLLQEKVVASAAKEFVVIADYRKLSEELGQQYKKGVPVEVVSMSHAFVKKKIESKYGGSAVLRQAKAKAGPVVTDNGNFILDWHFEGNHNWKEVDESLHMIPGVVETGLFVGMVTKAYFGLEDGTVKEV